MCIRDSLFLDLFWAKELGAMGLEVSDRPVRGASERCQPWWEGRAVIERGEEAELGDVRWVGLE